MRHALAGLALLAASLGGGAAAEAHDRFRHYAPYTPHYVPYPPPRIYYPAPYYYAPGPVYVVPRPVPYGYYAPYRPYRHRPPAFTGFSFTYRK